MGAVATDAQRWHPGARAACPGAGAREPAWHRLRPASCVSGGRP